MRTATQARNDARAVGRGISLYVMQRGESIVVSRRVDPGRQRRASQALASNVRRLRRKKSGPTAAQALAEFRRGRR